MMHGLKPGWKKSVVPAFNRVGSKLYGYADTINTIQVHALIQFAVFFMMLLGLILIYRKKTGSTVLLVQELAYCTLMIMGTTLFCRSDQN